MKVKTSVALSEELLEELDRRLGPDGNRSRAVEAALRAYLDRLARMERDERDRQLLDAHAEELDEEARDVLDYQADE